MFGKLWP